MSSGVNAFQIDYNFECADCGKDNEDISCWVEGDELLRFC